jgi:hypothetical protein
LSTGGKDEATREKRQDRWNAPSAVVVLRAKEIERNPRVTQASDRPFDWVAALAFASGAAVIVPSMAALAVALLAVLMALL